MRSHVPTLLAAFAGVLLAIGCGPKHRPGETWRCPENQEAVPSWVWNVPPATDQMVSFSTVGDPATEMLQAIQTARAAISAQVAQAIGQAVSEMIRQASKSFNDPDLGTKTSALTERAARLFSSASISGGTESKRYVETICRYVPDPAKPGKTQVQQVYRGYVLMSFPRTAVDETYRLTMADMRQNLVRQGENDLRDLYDRLMEKPEMQRFDPSRIQPGTPQSTAP